MRYMERFEALGCQSRNTSSSSRILRDVECKVCQDNSSGKHYGIFACDGCAGFFKRSIRRKDQHKYVCKGKEKGRCPIDKTHRNQCRACRLQKCIEEGMNEDAVQHPRGPRNATLQRQAAMYFKDLTDPVPPVSPGLDLSRTSSTSGNADERLDRPVSAHDSIFFYHLNMLNQVPIPPPPRLEIMQNPQSICEAAATVLFANLHWARSVPTFTNFPLEDQLLLLKESWCELFVLRAAHCLPPLQLDALLAECLEQKDRQVKDNGDLIAEAYKLRDVITKFKQLEADAFEYIRMSEIALLRPVYEDDTDDNKNNKGEKKLRLKEPLMVRSFHELSQQMLNRHVTVKYPQQPFRLGKLYLSMSASRDISEKAIEDLFFRRTIGHVSIPVIICGIYKSTIL